MANENKPKAFFYSGTDDNPPKSATGYALTPDNVSPAFAVWMLMTTNPEWAKAFASGQVHPQLGTWDDIARSAGLTVGSVQWLTNLTKPQKTAFIKVANQFQQFKETASTLPGGDSGYPPQYCPRHLEEIMRFEPLSRVKNEKKFAVPKQGS